MCGICGIVNFSGNPVAERDLRAMMTAMKHRGPDDEGVFTLDNVGLGFVRLSIIDLSAAGHQPMVSGDGRYVIVFNGEIFNYIELREELVRMGFVFRTKTDTEVLLMAYLAWGEECLHHFNGMWAFAIFDKVSKTLFAARDRYGIKPLYYYSDASRLIFASELKPILAVLDHKPNPNNQAIFDYLVFNRTDHNATTFFDKIYRVPHGFKLKLSTEETRQADKIDHGSPEVKSMEWYNLKANLKVPFSDPQEFYDVFKSSIELRLRSDVPVGVCLSGGLDSSSIVSVMLREFQNQELRTFSTKFGPGKSGDESEFIDIYKPMIQKMYFTVPSSDSLSDDIHQFIYAQSEPIPDTSIYAQYKVMELARKHVVVTLDGQGADEMLAGYHYFYGFYFKELLHKLKWGRLMNELKGYLSLHRSVYGLKSFAFFMLPNHLMTLTKLLDKGYLHPGFFNQYRESSQVVENLYSSKDLEEALIDHFEYKLEHLLKWEDRNSMWFSIEARIPFLDHRLVEKTLSLPSDQKIKNGWTKHIFREAMSGTLPEKIRKRKDKVGFGTPEKEWFRNVRFQSIIQDVLDSKTFKDRQIFDPVKAGQMHQHYLDNKGNFSHDLWKCVNLELWYRQFID